MAKLGDVCTVVSGTTPKSSCPDYWNGTLNWVTPAELTDDSDTIFESQRKITELAVSDSSLKPFPAGTVLLSSRAPIGKVAIAGQEMYCNQGFKNLVCSDAIYNRYLFHFLKSKTAYLNSLGRGATFKEISKSIVEQIEIPLPPLDDQHHIATVLDKVTDLIAQRRAQLDKLDLLVKARFVEMFGDSHTNPYNLPTAKWNDVFNTTTGKLDSNAAVVNGAYPFFTCSKIALRIDKYAFDQEALLLAGNNAAGKYDVKYYKGKFNAYQRTYVLSLKQNWSYELFRFQLEDKLEYLEQQSLGGLTKYLTLKILNELEFVIPTKLEQDKFAASAKRVEYSKLTIHKSLDKLEVMKKALMQQYFK